MEALETRHRNAERLVMQWNALYPVGTPVTVTQGQGRPIKTKTASPAQLAPFKRSIVYVESDNHPVSLYRVKPVPRP